MLSVQSCILIVNLSLRGFFYMERRCMYVWIIHIEVIWREAPLSHLERYGAARAVLGYRPSCVSG